MQTQQSEIQRLEFETRDLEQWRVDLKEERQRDQQQTQQFTQWTRQREQLEARFDVLIKQRDEVTRLNNLYERSKDNYDSLQHRLQDRQEELNTARTAQQAVEASRADYQRYQQANEVLKRLRQDNQKRNELRQQQSGQQNILAKIQTTITHLQTRLAEVAGARQRIIDLSQLV